MMITGIRLKEKFLPVGRRMIGLGHPHRVAILYLLLHKPFRMHEIAENIDLPSNLVSHHLEILCRTGWIDKDKQGKSVVYSIRKRTITDLKKLFEETPYNRGDYPAK